jgi:hypothetical protein
MHFGLTRHFTLMAGMPGSHDHADAFFHPFSRFPSAHSSEAPAKIF